MGSLAELLGKRIKEIRKEKGLRQEDMEALGLNYKYFQKIEQGRANVTLGTVDKVANALGVPAQVLFALPFSDDQESNEVASLIAQLIIDDEKHKIHKINVFMKELL